MTLESPLIFSVDKCRVIEHDLKGFPLFIDIKKEKLKRVAEIKSKVLLKNLTKLPLQFIVMHSQGVLQQEDLNDQTIVMPVAFNHLDKTLMMAMKSSLSQKLSIKDVINHPGGLIKLPLVCSKESYNNLNLEIVKKNGVVSLEAKPALKILNYCPQALEYQLVYRDCEDSNMIFRNKPVEIYKFDPYTEKCSLHLILNDVFETVIDLNKILNTKRGSHSIIKLVQRADKEMKVYLDVINDRDNGSLLIYSQFNIYNETGFDLDIFSFNHSSSSVYRPAVPSGNREIIFLASKAHDSILFKTNQRSFQNHIGVGKVDNRAYCVVPKKINCNLNQTIKGGSDKDKYELSLVFSPTVLQVTDTILTKTLTIAPKYVLVNNTMHKMNYIQKQCNHMFGIGPNSRQVMLWRSEHRECSFQIEDPRNL